MKRFVLAFMFLAGVVYASPSNTISVPNTFVPNTTIQSAQVNDDFIEVSNKFNAHSHTDITQLGTIISGIWSGTIIGTQFGGTGLDNSAVVQGSVPYFSAAGVMSNLTPSTAGSVLTTNGLGANPSWTTAVARNMITSGFEASASVGNLDMRVFGGSLLHNTMGVNVATTTVLTLATAGDWSSGSVVNYGGGAGWCYVGVTATATQTNKGVYLLGDLPPNRSDTSGNQSGTNLYSYDGTNYYRTIGAFRVNTSNRIGLSSYQSGNKILYDDVYANTDLRALNGGASVTFADVDLSAYVPKITTLVDLQIRSESNGTYLRQNGSSATNGRLFLTQITADSEGFVYDMPTDISRIIEYKVSAGSSTIYVSGYKLNIR